MKITLGKDFFSRDKGEVDAFDYRSKDLQETSIHYCVEFQEYDLLKEIIKNETPLSSLLGSKIINIPSVTKIYPIHLALANKDLIAFNILKKAKATMNVVDLEGKNIGHYALMNGLKNIKTKEPIKHIVCKIDKVKVLIFTCDKFTDLSVDEVNILIKKEKVEVIKIYFNLSELLKRSLNDIEATVLFGEKTSFSQKTAFLYYV